MHKLLEVLPMCGGYDKAFVTTTDWDTIQVLFCTNEGISTHRTVEHMNYCLEERGFAGCLDIKARAIPIAMQLLKLEDLSDNDKSYLEDLIQSWE